MISVIICSKEEKMGWKIASQKLKLQKKEQEKEPKSLIELIEIIPNDITNIKNIFML